MKKSGTRLISLLLILVLCLGALPVTAGAAEALAPERIKTLLNAEKLYPQRTGYAELDELLEKILKPFRGKDTYTQIMGMYDWTVENVNYSWKGYSQDFAPAYDKFTLKYDLEYETGLPKAYPEDMIYRAYHMLTEKTGVCYDWGILFAVMARYVGIESYVHTGILQIGSWTGHHGWTELKLSGKNYIFDAQQDNRMLKDVSGVNLHEHFGIAVPAARWKQETDANAARDASMLPVTAKRIRAANVTVTTSRSGGEISGAGTHPWGEEVTLTAPEQEPPFAGWYSKGGDLLSEERTYSFIPENDTEILALFRGDRFVDLPDGAWYNTDVCAAADRELLYGTTPVTFNPQGKLTRAMLVALLYRLEGTDYTVPAEGAAAAGAERETFTDVASRSWYYDEVYWALENELVYGIGAGSFGPEKTVTREEAATIMVRYLWKKGVHTTAAELDGFTDAGTVSGWAREAMGAARGIGLLQGYKDDTIRPKQSLDRAEGAAILMRMVRVLGAA